MTTTYKTTDYETAEALRDAINSDLSQLAYPFAVRHKVYGEGQLTFVKAPLIGGSLYATIDFAAGTKTLALDIVLAAQLLEMDAVLTAVLLKAQTAFKADFVTRDQAKREADRLAREQEREAAKKAKEAKEAEEKYQRTKANAIRDFEARTQVANPKSTADEFYYSLGWLATHAGTVSAVLPDYLETAFTNHFGAETPRRVVDSKHRGPAGWQAQWSWSFTISIKKSDLVPAFLSDKVNTSGNKVSDTSFIWDLVENYCFQFGKKQDVEAIRACVPADKIEFFEAGLSA